MKRELLRFVEKTRNVLSKNSPMILTGLGVAGLVTTTVMAVQATPKAMSILDTQLGIDDERPYDRFTKLEIIQATWKCYIPTAIMGGLTVVCVISANSISTKRNATIAGLYSLTEKSLKEYQSKVVEVVGENKAKEIKDKIAEDMVVRNPVSDNDIYITGKGDTLCYDALSGRYFKGDIERIRQSLNTMSRTLMTDLTVSLNDVYYELDLPMTKLGESIGWDVDNGLIDPDFSSTLTESGAPCLVLDFKIQPTYTAVMY